MNVTGSKCKPKSYVARYENTRTGYHVDLGNDSRFGYPLEIALGVVEPARARYTDVIHNMD